MEHDQLHLSERWTAMLGMPAQPSYTSRSWFERVHPDDLPGLREAIADHLNGRTPSLAHEYRVRIEGGDYLWVLVRGVAERCEQEPCAWPARRPTSAHARPPRNACAMRHATMP